MSNSDISYLKNSFRDENIADVGLHGIENNVKEVIVQPGSPDMDVKSEVLLPLQSFSLEDDKDPSKSCICCKSCKNCSRSLFRPCQRNFHPAPDNTLKSRIVDTLLCPPTGNCAVGLVLILTAILLWAIVWSITGHLALPGGFLFALIILGMGSALGGKIALLLRLPALIGMLIVGFMLRNVPYIDIAKDLNPEWSSAFRTIALAVILMRAGLGLDPAALRRLSFVCVRLAFVPCLTECTTVAVTIHFLLNFPWLWSFLLGFVLAAVSPAVIVPSMLNTQEKKLGTKKGIPTLIIAAASIDDILAIGGFGIVLGLTFATGDLITTIFHGPIEVLIGIAYGGIIGVLLWYLPESKMENAAFYHFVFLFGTGVFALFGSRVSGYAGSGALACLILAFVAAFGWRKTLPQTLLTMARYFAHLWTFFQPFLFGLIGSELNIEHLKSDSVGLGLATLAIGLCLRIIVTALVVFGVGFTLKERIFIALAWLPKATVQAAIGPVALDYVRNNNLDGDMEKLGIQILTIAVLSILITAPIGAAAIAISAPKLLTHDDDSPEPDLEATTSIGSENKAAEAE